MTARYANVVGVISLAPLVLLSACATTGGKQVSSQKQVVIQQAFPHLPTAPPVPGSRIETRLTEGNGFLQILHLPGTQNQDTYRLGVLLHEAQSSGDVYFSAERSQRIASFLPAESHRILDVNGASAKLSERDGVMTLAWRHGEFFLLLINERQRRSAGLSGLSEDQFLRLARSVAR